MAQPLPRRNLRSNVPAAESAADPSLGSGDAVDSKNVKKNLFDSTDEEAGDQSHQEPLCDVARHDSDAKLHPVVSGVRSANDGWGGGRGQGPGCGGFDYKNTQSPFPRCTCLTTRVTAERSAGEWGRTHRY